jgi:site-specific recombinase XerD
MEVHMLATAIEEFLLDGQAAGWSAGTVKIYRWHLARWIAWLAERQVTAADGLTRLLLRQWSASLADTWAPSTRKGAVTAVRAFVTWLQTETGLDGNLVKALKTPTVPVQVQRTLTATEVQALLAACEQPAEHGVTQETARQVCVRNAAIVALLYDSMLRAAECCALRITDLDLARGTATVRRGKGGAGRVAPFGSDTARLLRAWLEVRPAGGEALFVALGGSQPGAALTPRGLRMILKRLGERAGVAGVSPHTFRRGGVVACTLNGAPDRLVMAWAGWSDIRMVGVYTRALDTGSAALDAYTPYSPVAAAKRKKGA